jgi:hypothetical protein
MPNHLTLKQKSEIINFARKNPQKKSHEIKIHFEKNMKRSIGLTTIRTILNNREKILEDSNSVISVNKKKLSVGKYKEVEDALKIWCDDKEAINCPISDEMLKLKAVDFAKKFGIDNFKLSNGTLSRFKKGKA